MVRRIHKKLNGFLIGLTSVDSGRSSTIHQVRFLWQRWKLLQTAIVAVGLSIFGALLAALVYAASAARDPNLPLLKVTVSVSASDPAGNPLTYRWRSTDGRIIDQDAPSTQWTLPPGPGIHFAYVLVSNGKGGYTERRIAVNTDATGSMVAQSPPMNLLPPSAPTSSGVPFRDWLGGGIGSYSLPGDVNRQFKVALPDIDVHAITLNGPIISENTSTGLMGDFTVQNFSPPQHLADLGITCLGEGINMFRCFGLDASLNPVPDEVIDVEANQTNRVNLIRTGPDIMTFFTGSVQLEDGSACGTENEFFGVTSTASVEVTDINGKLIRRVRANSWGQFSIPLTPEERSQHLNVVVYCEGAVPASPTPIIPAPPPDTSKSEDLGIAIVRSRAPVVTSMSVTSLPGVTAKFDEPPKGLPSDVVPLRPAKFLAMKGLDTRRSGCQYYKAVGAVRDCDADGNFRGGAISFEDWKRAVKIDQFALRGVQQYSALFVNKVDLNLTRDHHSVSYGPGATAGYVCNHSGPQPTDTDPAGLFPSQADTNKVIENAAAGRNLIACVAMDYLAAPGVNNNMPFTRFLIFGPSGELLPSVNLDGLGEKFVPGTCVVCHGGNKYAGKFPEDGTGPADIEAHFLPFDTGSFDFHSSKSGLTKADQQEAIFQLNQNVLNTNTNTAEIDLINGWYKNGHVQNEGFFPPDIPLAFQPFYLNVIAKSCRTCHIAQRDELSIRDLNFSDFGVNVGKPGALSPSILAEQVCGQTNDLVRAYAMPNSAVTFNRFWLSRGTANDQPQQLGNRAGPTCTNPKAP